MTLCFLMLPQPAWATGVPAIVINEIFPQPADADTEWVELYRTDQNFTGFANWTVWDTLSQPSLLYTFTGSEFAISSYLTFAVANKLNNTGDTIVLKDEQGSIVDTLSYSAATVGLSWARLPNAGSVLSQVSPTYGASNPSPTPTPFPTATAMPTVQPTPTPYTAQPTPSPIQTAPPAALQLSEISPCPEMGTEWIELVNTSELPLSVEQVVLNDQSGTIAHFEQLILGAHSYYVIPISAKLNNSGDSVHLYVNEQLVDATSYFDCQKNDSYSFAGSWYWTAQSTKGSLNTAQPALTPAATSSPTTATNAFALSAETNSFHTTPTQQLLAEPTRNSAHSYERLLPLQLQSAASSDNLTREMRQSASATISASLAQPWLAYKAPVSGAIISSTVAILSSGLLLSSKW